MRTSTDFFLSGRHFLRGHRRARLSLGAQEVIGMAASGAKYGIMTSRFYWVGAIPAMVFSSGISMYARALFLNLLLGWDFNVSVWLSAIIVLVYISLGGFTSAICNEVMQFFLISRQT